jgi:hypothetical protein
MSIYTGNPASPVQGVNPPGTNTGGFILPYQNTDTVLLLADRYSRGVEGMAIWATEAKKCVEMVEGKQWTDEALAALIEQDRKAFKWNEIAPIVRLVLGYQRSTKTDLKITPSWQGSANDDVAQALTKILKQLAEDCQQSYIDTEVFMDGIVTGRGFYDTRLDFEKNELGELATTSSDPFSTILDPDADSYNLNDHGFLIEDRWVTIDEVEAVYGANAGMMLRPLFSAAGMAGLPNSSLTALLQTAAPWRYFGGAKETFGSRTLESYYLQSYDPARKNIRLLDCQAHVQCRRRYWIDLETGRKEPVDDSWTPEQIQKVLQWSQAKYSAMGQQSPIRLVVRPGKRIRWTTMVGDIVVYDGWSPYESYTKIGFFPWFRRGKTMGMVSDMIEPQEAINKAGTAEIDIISRSANTGWKYHKDALTVEEKARLEREGAAPGYNMEWKGSEAPVRIEPGMPPTQLDHLQLKNSDALKRISGINDSALGQLDRVQSGVAVEARQKQSVISVQVYMDNFSRSKELLGRKSIELVQNHYTEQRTYRIQGDDGKNQQLTINERLADGTIRNDITNGDYKYVIDETPLAKSFASAQFDETMQLIGANVLPIACPEVRDAVINLSSLPNKDALIKAITDWQQQQLQTAVPTAKAPAESLNYKDAPPDIQRQIEAQAGLQPSKLAPALAQAVPTGMTPTGSSQTPQGMSQTGGINVQQDAGAAPSAPQPGTAPG